MSLKKVKMFAGKGGVGKTTCASATALHHSLQGEKTLIISTDPTPSLSHIFEVSDKNKPVKILDNLYLAELGFEEIKQMWDKKFGREVYEVFSSFVSVSYPEFVEYMSAIVPGLGEEFMVDYIKELSNGGEYQQIVWDTAPLGQTLGLLETPAILREHLRMGPRIFTQLKMGNRTKLPILEIIKGWEKLSGEDMQFLRSGVDFTLVTIAEALAIEQLDGILTELSKHKFNAQRLLVNNVIKDMGDSPFLIEKANQQKQYLARIYQQYPQLTVIEIPLFPHEIKGTDRLKLIERIIFNEN
jgi:arsenite-transporting ATPase